jgi:hypothetical protein
LKPSCILGRASQLFQPIILNELGSIVSDILDNQTDQIPFYFC